MSALLAANPAPMSSARGRLSVGGTGPQVLLPLLADFRVRLPSLLCGRCESSRKPNVPPPKTDAASSWTDDQLGTQELPSSPPPGPELLDRVGGRITALPESFLPVTEPMCAAGISGDLVAPESEYVDEASDRCCELRTRRFRGRTVVASESGATERNAREEGDEKEFISSGILPTRSVASACGTSCDKRWTSDRRRFQRRQRCAQIEQDGKDASHSRCGGNSRTRQDFTKVASGYFVRCRGCLVSWRRVQDPPQSQVQWLTIKRGPLLGSNR